MYSGSSITERSVIEMSNVSCFENQTSGSIYLVNPTFCSVIEVFCSVIEVKKRSVIDGLP